MQNFTHSSAIIYLKVKAGVRKNEITSTIAIDGISYYKLNITQVAENGKANKYIIKFIAKLLRIKQHDITIIHGAKNNLKTISIKNISQDYLNSELSYYI